MSTWKLETPVALIVFNRPEPTLKVFEQIRAAKPSKLLIIADGPRADRPGEAERCAQARAIAQQVDWPCEVETEFSPVNLGCRRRVASGIDWVFTRVPEAIILEDDCLPHPSFFRYCAELLGRYREDARVGMIAGTSREYPKGLPGEASYFFSRYATIWGWATWRRAWARYDHLAAQWPELYRSGAFHGLTLPCERVYWQGAFEAVYRGVVDTWDYQWNLTCWCESMLCVVPHSNLISNIGYGPDATHTKIGDRNANLPVAAMQFPLAHPHLVLADRAADAGYAKMAYGERWRGKLKRRLGLTRLKRLIKSRAVTKPAAATP
jgi:hypothetical protein